MEVLFWVFFALAILFLIGFVVSFILSIKVERFKFSILPAVMVLGVSTCSFIMSIINLISKL